MLRFGQFDAAISLYHRALETRIRGRARIHNNLGVALARTGRLDEAETEFRRALELQPDMPEALQGLRGVERDRAADTTATTRTSLP
jgi:Flp pilus assembly protein TadD